MSNLLPPPPSHLPIPFPTGYNSQLFLSISYHQNLHILILDALLLFLVFFFHADIIYYFLLSKIRI